MAETDVKRKLSDTSLFSVLWCADTDSSSEYGAHATTITAQVATQVAAQHQQSIKSYNCQKAITYPHLYHSLAPPHIY